MYQRTHAIGRQVAQVSKGRAIGFSLDVETVEKARQLLLDGTPPNTRRAYASDLRYFWAWCSAIGWADEPSYPVPEEVVVRFIVDHVEGMAPEVDQRLVEAGFKRALGPHSINTVERRVYALSSVHKAKGLDSPCTGPHASQILAKARKAMARRGRRVRKKTAVVRSILDRMLERGSGNGLRDVRDAALLLFAWSSGGRRRSEVASATMENLEDVGEDFVYTLGITKADQDGEGRTVPIAGRAAAALRDWLESSGVKDGPIFRPVDRHGNVGENALCDRTVARIVKERAARAGLSPAAFAGHSLRSGFITEAGRQGKNLFDVMALSGHKTVQVAMGYHQAGAALNNEAARLVD